MFCKQCDLHYENVYLNKSVIMFFSTDELNYEAEFCFWKNNFAESKILVKHNYIISFNLSLISK